jgi:hypothetical protein
MDSIQSGFWDLLPVIRNHIYHPKFAGSYSIKNVLPALVPELSCQGMAVADGQQAGVAWELLMGEQELSESTEDLTIQ